MYVLHSIDVPDKPPLPGFLLHISEYLLDDMSVLQPVLGYLILHCKPIIYKKNFFIKILADEYEMFEKSLKLRLLSYYT